MPYMVDLHLFLGRPLASAANVSGEYTLSDMTPNMVHYGSIPESIMSEESENVHRLMNAKESGGFDAELLWSQRRVCANAMKQYRKTRPQASGHVSLKCLE